MGKPKNTSDLRFKFTAYKPTPPQPSDASGGTLPKGGGNLPPLARQDDGLLPWERMPREKFKPTTYKSNVPAWFDPNRDSIEPQQDGTLRLIARDPQVVGQYPGVQLDEGGGQVIDAGEFGKGWDIETRTEGGKTYRRYVIKQDATQQQDNLFGAQPGEQQFGLAPGDPETTLRGGLARFMGNPVVKIAETGLGGTLPGALVGSAILPGIGTVIGAGVGTGLSLLAGQQQFDENNVAARGLAVLGGAAIGQTLIPVPILGALIGGAAGLLMGPQVLDAARQGLEQGVGFAEQTIGAIVDPEKYGWQSSTLDGRLKEMGQAWEAARNTYESSTLDVRALTPEGWGKYDLFGREDAVFVDWDLPATTGGLTALVESRRRLAAGEDPAQVQADMAGRYGAPGQIRELASGFVLDPLNVAGDVQKAGLKGFAKVTGDTVLRDAIEGAGKGGMVDVMQKYKQLLTNEKQFRTGFDAAQDMNRLQRLVVGEDVIRLAQGQPYQEPKWWELWKLTPDSAAKDRVVQADNFVQAYLSQLPTDDNFGERALRVLTNLKDGPQYGPVEAGMDEVLRAGQTIEGRVVRQHLDLSAAQDTVNAWQQTADVRGELATIAEGAGLTPGEVVRRIAESTDDEGLVRLANELNARPSLTPNPSPIGEGGITVEKLKTLGKVFGDGAVPYTPEHLKAAIISGQIEASAKWAVNTFGIKPPPFMERVAAAVKAVQSTVLLGLNPSYVVNNIINGEVTMAARGVWGLRGLVEARDELARAGIEPARLASGGTIGDLDVSFDPGAMLGAAQEQGMRTIAEAQSYSGTLADIKRAGSTLSSHAPMTQLSPKIEKAQSLRAFYEGWKQHMGTNWRPGRSMPKLDPTLENQLARIDARLPGQLYAAAEAGLNPAEIYGAIFAERPTVRVQQHVTQVAQRLGMNEDDVARALAVDNLAGTLNDELAKAGSNPGKIDRAFDTVRAKAEEVRTQAHAAEVQTHAAYAAEAARVGDAGELLSLMDDVEMRLYETHQSHMRALEDEWQRINSSGGKSSQLKEALIAAQRDRAGKQWAGFFDYEDAVTRGMADGLKAGGLELSENFNTAAVAKRARIEAWNAEKNTLLDKFFALPDADRTPEAWASTTDAINGRYAALTNELDGITAKVDRYMAAEFARRYDAATGAAMTAWRDGVRAYKTADMAEVQAFRQKVSKVRSAPLKDKMWREFNEARLKRLHEIEQESIGLRRKAQEAMWESSRVKGVTQNNAPSPQPSPIGEGVQPPPQPSPADAGEGVPVTIGDVVIAPEEAAAIADVVQREMAVQAAASELARPLDKPVVRFRDGMMVPAEWLDDKGQLRIPPSAEVSPGSMSVAVPQSARDYLEMQVREFVRTKGQANAMTDAVMALVDARAEVWAQQTGLRAEDYIPRHFALGDPGDITFVSEMNRAGGEVLQQRTGRARAVAAGQADMFAGPGPAENADLPLFSGTASGAAESVFKPQDVGQQASMFDMRPEFGGAPSPQPSPIGEGARSSASGPLFEQQPPDLVDRVVSVDWGNSSGSGKRSGGMVRGSMSDAPRGVKEYRTTEYADFGEVGASGKPKRTEYGVLSQQQKNVYNAARDAGVSHADALQRAFDEVPSRLFQAGKTTKGSVQFLEDGRAVLRALTAPDVSTAAHEVGHVFLRDLMEVANDAAAPGRMQAAADVQTTMEWLAAEAINLSNAAEGKGLTPAQRSAFGFTEGNNWIDAIDDAGNLTTSGQEIWARGFERFLADGTAPTAGLRRVFEQFKQWLGKIYSKVRGRNEIDVNMSADMRQVYERLFAESDGTPTTLTLPSPIGEGARSNAGAIAPVENPQLIARHELPGQLPNAMEEWARQAMNDLNAGTPGQRIFGEEGQGVIASQSSTYPDWYKAMSARYGTGKQQVINALDKIVRDHGTDTGLTVERLKELGLKELANGFEVVGARIPADPEARALLGLEVTPEIESAWAAMRAQIEPSPLTPNPSPIGRGETYYQSGPGEMTVQTERGPVTVTAVDDETVTVNGQKVRKVPTGDAPLPPGVLADQGARPMPIAQALDESWANNLRPIINGLQDEVRAGKTRGSARTVRSLPPELQAGIEAWVSEVNGKLASAKLQATKWGEYKRDSALLNYSRRYKYNTYLGMVSPYEFFTTQSMVKWALHSIDRPSVLANYYRTSKFLSTEVTKAGFPSRLGGQVQIPLPFLPEWAGGGVFVDPMKVGLPLQNWAAPWEQEQSRQQRLNYRIESTINQWMDDGQITLAEGQAALKEKGGELWQRASTDAVAKDKSLGADAIDTAMSVLPPSLPLGFVMNKLRGKEGDISQLPPTRYAKAIGAALGVSDTVGQLDKSVRRAMDLPVLDDWTAYRIDTELANLAATGAITADEAKRAMISREGPAYQMAERREAEASAFSVAGGLTFGTSIALYPEGEKNLRDMQLLYKAARAAEMDGDTEALNRFFDQNPAYEARLALYKNPDERLRNFLTSSIWQKWMDMPSAYKQDVQQALGYEFDQAFLNKETRSYADIPMETLARWARTMGEQIPSKPDTKPLPVDWSPPATVQAVEQYYQMRQDLFDWPAVRDAQTEYYAIPADDKITWQSGVYTSGAKRGQPKYRSRTQRDIYVSQHPELDQYWTWRKEFLKQYPQVQGYLDEQKIMMADDQPSPQPSPNGRGSTVDWQPEMARAVVMALTTGRELPPATKRKVLSDWQAAGGMGSWEQWAAWQLGMVQ